MRGRGCQSTPPSMKFFGYTLWLLIRSSLHSAVLCEEAEIKTAGTSFAAKI